MEQSTALPIGGPTPDTRDVLTEFLRDGARSFLAEAVAAQVARRNDEYAHLD